MNRLTVLGNLVATTAVASFCIAFLADSLAPAVAGASLAFALFAARQDAHPALLSITRRLPRRVSVGQPATIQLEIQSSSNRPWRIQEQLPEAWDGEAPPEPLVQGEAKLSYTGTARAPGRLQWRGVHATGTDRWGLWRATTFLPAPDNLWANPEPAWAVKGRAIGKRHRVQTTIRSKHGVEPQPDIERVREYQPGDRVRDIDWKRGSLQAGLWTRERERSAPRPVTILLDAGPSMREVTHSPRIQTASELIIGIAGAAEAAGVSCSLIAFHEGGILSDVQLDQPGGTKMALSRLAKLPAPTAGVTLDAHTMPVDASTGTFLRQASQLDAGTAGPPWQVATSQALSRSKGIVIAVLDPEFAPRRSLQQVKQLVQADRDVVACILPWGPHALTRSEGDANRAVLDARYQQRQRYTLALERLRVPVITAYPGEVPDAIAEVARCVE